MRRTVLGLPLVDVALAAVLAAVKLGMVAAGWHVEPVFLTYVAALLLTVPLACRRRYPLGVTLVVQGAFIGQLAVLGFDSSIMAIDTVIVASYSLAAYSDGTRRALLGLAVTLAGSGWAAVEQAGGVGSASLLFANVFGNTALVLVPFFAGLALRAQRLRARAMEELAHQLQRERDEHARAAVAEERERIARELHDEIAHAMSVIAVQADAAEGALSADPLLVRAPLVAIRDTARGALGDMRRVLGMLRGEPAALTPAPGLARIDGLLEQARGAGLAVDLHVEGEPAPLPPAFDLAAYRVVQEGLTNVRKHSGADRADVVVRYRRDLVEVEVLDAGDGSGAGGGSGHGLAGIRERIAMLGGEFVAGPRERGFALKISLPLT